MRSYEFKCASLMESVWKFHLSPLFIILTVFENTMDGRLHQFHSKLKNNIETCLKISKFYVICMPIKKSQIKKKYSEAANTILTILLCHHKSRFCIKKENTKRLEF
jgi:hypothetical protein